MTRPQGAAPAGASAGDVFAVAAGLVSRLVESQLDALAAAADLLASRLLAGGSVYVFGTGHSRAIAMELAGRAGGLAGMKELVLDDLVASGRATKEELMDGTLERQPDAASALLEAVPMAPGDAFIVVSHSGCNGAPVEMAMSARRAGLPVVAITSLEHSRAVVSRHPSGLRLHEVATLCVDTCAPYADTAIRLPSQLGVCSVSSFSGVLLAQALTAEIVGRYLQAGVTPPLLVSRNLPGCQAGTAAPGPILGRSVPGTTPATGPAL
jgi:uncharacterized phosphosugar-binding protein